MSERPSPEKEALKPFATTYSPQLPELLQRAGCSLALTTYQAGKLVFFSPSGEEKLVQLPRTFEKAMGIGLDLEKGKMALASHGEVTVFKNSSSLASHYPASPNTYDALFMPRARYYTGPVDIHDLEILDDGLYAINTLFSCLVRIDEEYSFTPVWKPPFISRISSEDRCHLNGLAVKDGRPKYVTAFGTGDEAGSWREDKTSGGVVIDIETDEVIAENLPMPHSPRMIDGELYVLLSATGELARIDTEKGGYEVVIGLDGFVRGMSYHKDLLFIGLSKLRKNASVFGNLDIARSEQRAGIKVVHLPTAGLMGEIHYQTSVDEIYDVEVLPDMLRPNILNTDREEHKMGLVTPETTFWGKRKETDNSNAHKS